MEIAEISAQPRETHGGRACRRLRRQDLVPAVMYGQNEPNVLLSLQQRDVEHLIHEHAYVVRVNWDGRSEPAQIKDMQYDALGDDVLHVDLMRISLTETVVVEVPLTPHGEPAGVEDGGTLDLVVRQLEVECLPTAIPESIRIEVAQMGIGDVLHVADIALPEGVKALAEPEMTVATVVPPQEELEEEAEPLAGEMSAEPKVIGRETEGGAGEEGEPGRSG